MINDKLKIELRDGVYHLSGPLNEYAKFDSLLQAPEPIRMNLHHVTHINSIGIRNLLKFLKDLGGKQFQYEACSPAFIDQLNMIPSLLGTVNNGKILSLFVTYECESCPYELEVLRSMDQLADGGATSACPKCGAKLQLMPDGYLDFLAS